jgi:hypothetical protein
MQRNKTWQRVGKARPCPICGRIDWCLYTGQPDNPEAVICARVESSRRCGEAGWLHHLRDSGVAWCPLVRRIELSAARIAVPSIDFGNMAAVFRAAVQPQALSKLAASLGLSAESLGRLGIGWSAKNRAWSFPMMDADGQVLGIRLRRPDGTKLSVKGGHEGLFVPEALPGGRLLIAEGPTDTAALLDMEFNAVGRPSCTGGVKLLVDLVQRLAVPEVVIVADGDEPGQRGAGNLAAVLAVYCPSVRVIVPPGGIKDARAWKRSGATSADVQAMIDAAPVRRLAVKATLRKRKAGASYGR